VSSVFPHLVRPVEWFLIFKKCLFLKDYDLSHVEFKLKKKLFIDKRSKNVQRQNQDKKHAIGFRND
jgi:hypothetical protein